MKHKIEQLFAAHNITNITANSRLVGKNCAFFALKGVQVDGNDYIQSALQNGATIVFTDRQELSDDKNIYYLEDNRLGFALASHLLHPSKFRKIIAVTGTNGKSSVVFYIHQILNLLGKKNIALGTLGINSNIDLQLNDTPSLTTYDSLSFAKILQKASMSRVEYVAFEASSHGLEQKRIAGVRVDAAGFTSFSPEHLDYHKDMYNYLDAKMMLFYDYLTPDARCVLNSDMSNYLEVVKKLTKQTIEYDSVGKEGDVKILTIKSDIDGQEVSYEYGGSNYSFLTRIIGSFQIYNLLIAAKLVSNVGFSFKEVASFLGQIEAAPGRLERVTELSSPYHIFVDYAHTPDALEKSLLELKKLCKFSGRLVVVFGCGGERDKSKRPLMGEIAAKIADLVVVTDDNPRHEDPIQIIKEVAVDDTKTRLCPGRKKAIIETVASLQKDDILLIAGKGHEDYQILGDNRIYFSDVEVAKSAIKNGTNCLDSSGT